MREKVSKYTCTEDYYPSDVVRIVNPTQAATYINHGARLIDMHPSRDFKTNKPILVYILNREETTELYDKWCAHELD